MPETFDYDYTYQFDGISDQLRNSRLRIVDHCNEREFTILVSVDDRNFLQIRGLQVPSRIADLIDLAIAIYEADRWSKRTEKKPCVIRVCLPVRHPDVLQSEEVLDLLKRILYWYTGDVWVFEFQELSFRRRVAELQRPLWKASNEGILTEVALWSGGLDSLAGLCNRIDQQIAERFLLFGVGGNARANGVQQTVYASIRDHFDIDLSLMQLPIHQRDTKQKGLRRDEALRARGLVFILLGSAYAQLEGQNRLALYENGIGAINLPFRASEVGLDHARAVHPISLQNVGTLLTLILDKSFSVHNPFLFSTKAEMCRILAYQEIVEVAWETESCDRPHRKKVVSQCGRCSSCLLRRLSFLAAGIPDRTPYLTEFESGDTLHNLFRTSHLPHMLYQVAKLRFWLSQDNAWDILAHQYPTLLADLVYHSNGQNKNDEFINNLLDLFKNYTDEWAFPRTRSVFEAEIERIRSLPKRTKKISTAKKDNHND